MMKHSARQWLAFCLEHVLGTRAAAKFQFGEFTGEIGLQPASHFRAECFILCAETQLHAAAPLRLCQHDLRQTFTVPCTIAKKMFTGLGALEMQVHIVFPGETHATE